MPPPKHFKFSVNPVLRRYILVSEGANQVLLSDERFTPHMMSEYVEAAAYSLKLKEAARPLVAQAVAVHCNEWLDRMRMRDITWRVAAGYPNFVAGIQTESQMHVGAREWVGLRIEQCCPGRPFKNGKASLRVFFRILSGSFAGLLFDQRLPSLYVTGVLAKEIGWPRYGKVNAGELVQACLVGEVSFTLNCHKLEEIHPASSTIRHNRTLRMERKIPERGPRKRCPGNYKFPCHECSRGYESAGQDGCGLATHPLAYTKADCSMCKRTSFFEQWPRGQICVLCERRIAKRKVALEALS